MTVVDLSRAPVARAGAPCCRPLLAGGDVAAIGEKARALGRMMRAGISVPSGFVLTTDALEAHLAARALGERVAKACRELDVDDARSLARTSRAIRSWVRGAELPEWVREELLDRARPLLALGPVVVRSSAVGEDSAGQSFAGQLDSILHVRDEASLEQAVLECWSSFWSERALFYRRARKVEPRGMGVVVQHQVDAAAAGVMFTATMNGPPLRIRAGAMVVEYTRGLGDALVAGEIDPGRLTIDRETGGVSHLAGATCPSGESFVLGNTTVRVLQAVGVALEQEFKEAQDVEWVLAADGALFVVQSRPITAPVVVATGASRAIPRVARNDGEWARNDSGRRVAWSNANVNENFPAPISPLLYSIASAGYTHYFRNLARAFGISADRIRAMDPAFQRIIGVHGARMYYNLTSIHSVIRLAPFGGALAASFDSFVGADGSSVESRTAGPSGTWRQVAEVAVIATKTARRYLSLERSIQRFERTVDAFAARTDPSRLARLSLAELRAALADFMEIRCHKWLDASLADAASMVCYGALERLLRRAYPDARHGAVHTSLLKAIPDVISGEPVHRLWDLSRQIRDNAELHTLVEGTASADVLRVIETDARYAAFRAAFTRYLDDWGFRCSQELMLTSPSFQEDPSPLIEILRAYARVDGESPLHALAAQAAERAAATIRVTRALSGRPVWRRLPFPTYAFVLRILLPWTHAAIRYRERARLKQALLYSRCRRIALALGDELTRRGIVAERDDAFFLTVTELDELASGGAMLPRAVRSLVASRRAEHDRLAAMTPPDSFTLEEGESFDERTATESQPIVDAGNRLSGVAACGGQVSGRATVMRDVTEAARLARGDILVTKQTDPGWGPVFFLISGLVIERGGMLSHGAIIAREFGIPCVVGVRDAMRRIPSGATISVDGDRGEVHVGD